MLSCIPSHVGALYTRMENRATVFSENLSGTQDGGFYILPLSEQPMATPDPPPIEPLSIYVQNVMREHGLTVYAVERQARKRGGSLGKSTVDGIIQKTIKNPGIFTLRELAWGLGRPVEEVVSVALGVPNTEKAGFTKGDFANLWDGYSQLDKASRNFIDKVLEMLDREMRRLLSRD